MKAHLPIILQLISAGEIIWSKFGNLTILCYFSKLPVRNNGSDDTPFSDQLLRVELWRDKQWLTTRFRNVRQKQIPDLISRTIKLSSLASQRIYNPGELVIYVDSAENKCPLLGWKAWIPSDLSSKTSRPTFSLALEGQTCWNRIPLTEP